MEAEKFDGLTRTLAAVHTRRSLLPLVGGLGIALVAADTGGLVALAKKSHKKQKKKSPRCPRGTTRCRNGCLPAGLKCCSAPSAGFGGACDAESPVCCPASQDGGCCPSAYPVCCRNECCAVGDFCDEDGFCFYGLA